MEQPGVTRVSRRAFGRLLLGSFLIPALTGCVDPKRLFSRSGGTLRISGSSPRTLDPALAEDSTSWGYLIQIYSGLVRLDDQLRITPDLARAWTVSPDGRTYTFTLREDLRFQDGRTVTADDLKYSLERALDPATGSTVSSLYLGDLIGAAERRAGKAAGVDGLIVVDPRTLRLTIDAPKSYFLAKLTHPTAYVVDRQNVGRGPDWSKQPNGTGPFRLKSWQENQSLVLERSSTYYGTAPSIDEIEYYVGPEPPLGLYQQGKLDLAWVGTADVPRVTDPAGPYRRQLISQPTLALWFIGFNVRRKPFDDPKVRLAFASATDRRLLINGVFRGSVTAATQILPPGMAGYDPTLAATPLDPDRARRLLSESTYGSAAGLPKIEFAVDRGQSTFALGLAQMYRANLGVDISVVVYENSYYDELRQHTPQLFTMGWIADYPDPQDFLDILFGKSSDSNYTDYDNPAVETLLRQASLETETQRRIDLYRQAQRLILQDAPIIPLYNSTDYLLVREGVEGLTLTPLGILSFAGVTVRG